MAIQTSLITFTGKLGNMIGYRRNDKYLLRSAPETVRQTAATRRAARRFGMASRKGALIRSAFSSELDVQCDGSHVNRLNKLLIQAGRDNTGAITGFRFNRNTGIDKFFTIAPKVSQDGILHIPAQVLPQFKGITALEIKVIAARINLSVHQVVGTEAAVLILDTRESFAGAAISVDVPGKGVFVVTFQVRGIYSGGVSGSQKYQAADIVAVQEPQISQVFYRPSYPQHNVLRRREGLLNVTDVSPVHVIQRE